MNTGSLSSRFRRLPVPLRLSRSGRCRRSRSPGLLLIPRVFLSRPRLIRTGSIPSWGSLSTGNEGEIGLLGGSGILTLTGTSSSTRTIRIVFRTLPMGVSTDPWPRRWSLRRLRCCPSWESPRRRWWPCSRKSWGWELRDSSRPVINLWTTFVVSEQGEVHVYAAGGVMVMAVGSLAGVMTGLSTLHRAGGSARWSWNGSGRA